jgi:hypothetical protein
MGDISREARDSRFIAAFNDLIVKKQGVQVGTTCEVKSCALGHDSVDGCVRLYAMLAYAEGDRNIEIEVMLPEKYFDPEGDPEDDVDYLAGFLGIELDEIRRLLQQAKLLD